ncbi:MAG TPA: helix-turn-helix transcriptional regulator [Beijerinckiaceae bacterium]
MTDVDERGAFPPDVVHERGLLAALLGRIGCGCLGLDEIGRPIWSTARADEILARCGAALTNEVLRSAAQAARAVATAEGYVLWLVVDSRSAPPRFLHRTIEPAATGVAAAVLVDVTQPLVQPRDAVGAAFGLTRAENATAAAVAEGASPAQIPAARGVSEPTVRSQLSAALEKTGTRRQSELAVLLTRLNLLP